MVQINTIYAVMRDSGTDTQDGVPGSPTPGFRLTRRAWTLRLSGQARMPDGRSLAIWFAEFARLGAIRVLAALVPGHPDSARSRSSLRSSPATLGAVRVLAALVPGHSWRRFSLQVHRGRACGTASCDQMCKNMQK